MWLHQHQSFIDVVAIPGSSTVLWTWCASRRARVPQDSWATGRRFGAGRWRAGTYPGMVRLVSLLPSATEIVYALGLGDDLAGVTFECDEPPAARTDKVVVVGGRGTSGVRPGGLARDARSQ